MPKQPFSNLKTESKAPRFTKDQMREWMNQQKPRKSSTCALLVGHNKTGKSGVVVDSRTNEQKEKHMKVVIFELNMDNGCEINSRVYHNNDPDIIILNPREYTLDAGGEWVLDRVATMEKVKTMIQTIKEDCNNDSLNLAVLALDGLDSFLSNICENQMRIDEHIDISGGVSPRYWKKRNDYYNSIIEMMLSIDVDLYFITHYAEKRRDSETGKYDDNRTSSRLYDNLIYSCEKLTADKMHQIIEFEDKTTVVSGRPQPKLIATIISDRCDLGRHLEEHIIAELNGDKIEWKGQALLHSKK